MSPGFQLLGMSLTGTIHVSSPLSSLNSILTESGPLGGVVVVHTAP